MNAYERLSLGIQQLRTRGHCTGNFRVDGRVCLVGSMLRDDEMAANNTDPARYTLLEEGAIADAVKLAGFEDWIKAFVWNDGIESGVKPTLEEVLARLEAARDRILHQEADKAGVSVALETEASELVGVA